MRAEKGTGDAEKTRTTRFTVYMDTFIRRRTTIRNKSISEFFQDLGAAFAAAMFFVAISFKEEDYTTSKGIQKKVKIFRFHSTESVLTALRPRAFIRYRQTRRHTYIAHIMYCASKSFHEGLCTHTLVFMSFGLSTRKLPFSPNDRKFLCFLPCPYHNKTQHTDNYWQRHKCRHLYIALESILPIK